MCSGARAQVHSKHTNETSGQMVGTPAITALDTGFPGGRVVLNSPHPELPPLHVEVYAGELAWLMQARR